MAKSGKTAQEFIKDSFSPIVAVLCSPKVEYVVAKNNLSFTELLHPFTTMDWEGHIKEPGGGLGPIKNWKLVIRDVNWKPLQPTEARRQLNNAVLHNYHDKIISIDLNGRKFDIPQSTYWFDAWRETYLDVQFPSDHEFTKHFLSCIIVGVAHDDNIVETFNTLNQQYAQLQNVTPPKLPKWFNSGILKSYLLLHDASVISREKADVTFETLKKSFGPSNCFILSINSKSASDPLLTDLWAPFIKRSETSNDLSVAANQPLSPTEPPATFPAMNVNLEDGSILPTAQLETSHPLTATENDVYDNANSLQTHSFSGSSESVSVTSKGVDLSMEVHGGCLNMIDIDDIKKFLQDYSQKSLLPYLEKQIAQLSEAVANRKGVSRSLLSATKRWFGTGKTGSTAANNTVIYTNDCPELQLRRLGDLWFMCGQWQRAFDVYHTAKREFYADSAWLFYAGALEMAALSAFMAGDANRKTHAYMEESIVTYLNTCRMVQYAVRATLLSVLCLNSAGLHGEAAKQLIRMTSEDSDLRSAMLLEQASLCFLSGPGNKAMCRKYAFHMVLAGHRFSKAGQKKHAYRCYNQAYQVYSSSGWRLATDHVQFALGRLAGALRAPGDALRWLAAPLAPARASATHLAAQHHAFLREYMHHFQQWRGAHESRDSVAVLPVPAAARGGGVSCAGPAPLWAPRRAPAAAPPAAPGAAPAPAWRRLEEMLVQAAQGALPMIFKPTVDYYDDTTDADPVVPKGEPVQISITLWNPLKIPLVLRDAELLWRFTADGEEALSNEPAVAAGGSLDSTVIFGQKIKSTLLEPDSNKVIMFTLTPMKVGQLSVHGLAYELVNIGEGGNENGSGLSIFGKLDLLTGVKSADRRLQITVIPEAPCLQMTFSETNPDILSGEMRTIDVEFTNVGPVEMKNLFVAVSHPDCVRLGAPADDSFSLLHEDKYRAPRHYADERSARAGAWARLAARHCARVRGALAAGEALRVPLQLRPVAAPALSLLAYYHTGLPSRPYRLLRHQFRFRVQEAVQVSVSPKRSIGVAGSEPVEDMNLAVEVKNVGDASLELLEAALAARQWRLAALLAPAGRDAPLAPRESVHFVLKARRIKDPLPPGKVDFSNLKISGANNDKHLVDIPSYSTFVMDGTQPFCESNDSLVVQPSSKPGGLIESMFILRWKVNNKNTGAVAIGQHCLWLQCFSKAQSPARAPDLAPPLADDFDTRPDYHDPANKNKNDNVVLFGLEHSKEIKHNFHERKICLVPITLNVVNCYSIPIDIFIDMAKQKNRECSGEIGWAGALSAGGADGKSVGVSLSLQAFEARRVPLRALCAAPGAYLLGPAVSLCAPAAAAATVAAPLNIVRNSDNNSLLLVTSLH